LSEIPKPDEARQNARLLEETRKNLNQAVAEAEVLRKEIAALRQVPPSAAAKPAAASELEAQLQAARVAQSAVELELQRMRGENEKLRTQLAAMAESSKTEVAQRPGEAALKRVDRARLAMAEARLAEAKQLLEAELGANQDSAEAWYLMGRVRLEAGEFTEAAAALKRALDLSPELGTVHLEFARLYHRQPRPDLALSRWHYHRAMGLGSARDQGLEKEIAWEQPPAGR
jgi:tetratricopeptide (TPR) repeat protein